MKDTLYREQKRKRRNPTSNECNDSINFSTQITTSATMSHSSTNTNLGEGRGSDSKDHPPLGNLSDEDVPHAPDDDEDRYHVTVENGFMKVSMAPISKPGVYRIESSNKVKGLPDNIKGKSPDEQSISYGSQMKIPETVLQFQRQLRKTQAAKRASTPLPKSQLQILYDDEHIVVVNKPSGVLTVPGVNSNPSILSLLYEIYEQDLDPEMKPEHMIVHRLDMDTSGVVLFAKSKKTLLKLQALFRDRDGVSKHYEAVVCGHLNPEIDRGTIDLPLQRDHRFPPFMRVATPRSEREAQQVVKDLKNAGWKKIVKKKAKPSQTEFQVIGREYRYFDGNSDFDKKTHQHGEKKEKANRYPVTRLKLTLKTGRTHQLRVHCAAIGHPILGDPAYGIYGEASSNGGFEDNLIDELVPNRASMDLQLALDRLVKEKGLVMCLHARELKLNHPETGKLLTFEHPPDF